MYYPKLNNVSVAREVTSVFRGYNHNAVIGDGEFYEMRNMTSDLFPVLSPRAERGRMTLPEGTRAKDLCAAECMAYVDGSALVLLDGTEDGRRIEMGLGETEHRIAALGAYLIVFPEGKYVNTLDPEEWGTVQEGDEARAQVSYTLYDPSGKAIYDKSTAMANSRYKIIPEILDEDIDGLNCDPYKDQAHYIIVYHRTANYGTERWVYAYNEETDTWSKGTGEGFYTKAEITIFEDEFKTLYNGKMSIELTDHDKVAGIYDSDEISIFNGHIRIFKTLNEMIFYTSSSNAVARLPVIKLDHVVACGNRLWGCRYGESSAGDIVNELYATKLGDFKRWRTYVEDGAADDSWASSVGTPGAFTGAAVYGGRVYFFKKDRIFAMYGSDTTSFGYTEIVERGVQEGCADSLCVLDGYLYYKSPDGVVRFDGNSTQLLSDPLGYVRYTDAVAGGWRGKYYLSMKDADGDAHLFVLDTRRGLWHREDTVDVDSFLNRNDVLYVATKDGEVLTIGDVVPTEGAVTWMVQTGIIGLDDPDKKYISKLSVRLKMELGARVRISIQYDSAGDWETVFLVESDELRTVTVPVLLHRCDHFRMRIEGVGDVRIYSITKTIEQGGCD